MNIALSHLCSMSSVPRILYAISYLVLTLAVCSRFSQTWSLTKLTLKVHFTTFDPLAIWVGEIAMSAHWHTVLSSLTHLTLHLRTTEPKRWVLHNEHPIDLSTLKKANRLQCLDISMSKVCSSDDGDQANYYPADFWGPDHSFPRLQRLRLRGMRAMVQDFLNLFEAQPALVRLELGDICFTDDVEISPGGDAAHKGALWTLIEGVYGMETLESSKLVPPFLRCSIGILISKEEWMMAKYEDKIDNFLDSLELSHPNDGARSTSGHEKGLTVI